uniref:Ragulator complex protein LAMTOR1 n=1 Tax=Monodelphis domestica TaxID=13616 RepID=A0A5F8GCA8_MONDO
MGSCCCSCEEEEGPEPDEQARLLEPPGEQDRASTSDSQSCPDEQAVLASILARAASSIIAVGAAQVQRLAPQECLDRARLYRSRLAHYWKKKEPSNMALPTLTNHPYRVLAGALVPYADVQLAIHIAVDAHLFQSTLSHFDPTNNTMRFMLLFF